MKLSKKILIIGFGIFLLAAGCGKSSQQAASQPISQSANQPISKPANQQPAATGTATATPGKIKPPAEFLPQGTTPTAPASGTAPTGQTQTIQNAGKPDYRPGFIIVTQRVQGSNLNQPYVQILDGASAYDLLTIDHKVTAKDFGAGMGEMVLTIDGIKPDSSHFWEFLVNGKFSNVGASTYVLKDGDTIDWKLDTIK